MENNDNKAMPEMQSPSVTEEFLTRNKGRERKKKTQEQIEHEQMKQFLVSAVVFSLATVLTLIFLFSLELYFVEPFPDYGFYEVFVRIFVSLKRALERSDIIFLVFSLSLTVIIEGITSRGRSASKFVMVAEAIIGLSALVFYIMEETHMRKIDYYSGEIPVYLSNNLLIESRLLIHVVWLIGVIFFALLGYYMRAQKIRTSDLWKKICIRYIKKANTKKKED